MTRLKLSLPVVASILMATCAHAEITDTAVYRLPHSTYAVLRGTANLPSEGLWQVRAAGAAASGGTASDAAAGTKNQAVAQLYLIPPKEAEREQIGRRMSAALRETRTDQGRWKVRSVYEACRDFALLHNGDSPTSVDDFDKEKYRHLVDTVQDLPRDWENAVDVQEAAGPLVGLVKAKFIFSDRDNRRVDRDQRQILAVELWPYVNDGKHWVLYTDGTTLREPIDQELVDRNNFVIRPILGTANEEIKECAATFPYTVVAVRDHTATGALNVTFFNSISGDEATEHWNPAAAAEDKSVADTLRAARRYAWLPYLNTGPAPCCATGSLRRKPVVPIARRPGLATT